MNHRSPMRALRNRLEKIAGSQSAWADQDPAKRTFGTASPRPLLVYPGYILQAGRPGGLPRTKREKQFPCVASHSRAGGNLSESTTYWIPAFAGMTSGLAIEYSKALLQQPASAVSMLWWGDFQIARRDGGFPSGLKTRRAQHRVNLIRGQDARSL